MYLAPVRRCTTAGSSLVAALALSASLAVPAFWNVVPVAAAPAQKFPMPTGRITYKMSGLMGMSGTMTMSWAGHGQKFRQDMAMSLPAMPGGKMNTWTISDGKTVYVSNSMMGKKAMRVKVTPQMANTSMPGVPGMNVAGGTSGKLVGHANVLGKPCEIRLMTANTPQMDMRMKLWTWRNLPLKIESSMKMKSRPLGAPGSAPSGAAGRTMPKMPTINTTMTATKLDLNPKLSPALFKVPAGYTIQDASSMGRRQRPTGR